MCELKVRDFSVPLKMEDLYSTEEIAKGLKDSWVDGRKRVRC